MKKSECYYRAIAAVINSNGLHTKEKIEVIELLMHDMNLAKFCEENEGAVKDEVEA